MTENPQGFWRRKAILAALFIAVVLLAGVVSATAASPEVAWNVTFKLENENKFDAVAPSADGGLIAIGSTLSRTSGEEEDVMLVKTDGAGNQVWLKRLPGMAPASVAAAADGGCIAGVYSVSINETDRGAEYQGTSFLIRLDAAGEEEWQEALPGMKVSSVAKTPDGGYLAAGWLWNPAGSENETTGVLLKTDGNGTPIWNRTFPGTAVNTAIVTSDGGYLVGGTSSPFTYDMGDGFLIRLDADGNTLWSRNYQVPVIFDLEETADGGFVYSGNYWYGLVDQDGDEAWARKMEGLTSYAVGIQPPGGYLVAGTNAASGEGFVFGTDTDGAILWKMTFPGSRVYAAASVPGGGYVLAGIQFISTGNSTAWLAGITEPGEETEEPVPTATAPGFGAAAAGAALVILITTRCRRG